MSMQHLLKDLAQVVGGRVIGDPTTALGGVASFDAARAGDLVFAEEPSHLAPALACAASAILAGEFAANRNSAKPWLIVENPRLAFARAAAWLRPRPLRPAAVHPSAVVHASAQLAANVSVDACVVIGENVVIGDASWIGAGTVIGARVSLGQHCDVHPNVTIYPDTSVGDRVTVHAGAVLGSDGFGYVRDPGSGRHHKFPQVGTLRIEDDVDIGANTTLDRGALDSTIIARGSKLDNLVQIGHNVRVGQDVVIAAQVGISGSSVIEDRVVMAGQVGIGDHARIESGVILGGQCGVLPNKVVRGDGMMFWGTPARPLSKYLKQLAALARLGRKG
jgi:UDP-3-O-[3-hydroxymyristoyl] glucosamine N-acyltransferase